MRLAFLLALLAASLGARSARLLYVDAPADAPAALHLVAGKASARVDLPRLAISSGKAELPAGPLRLHLAERAPTEREPLPAGTPHVDLPAGEDDVLVILLPSGKPGPLGFRAQFINFSPGRLPEGGSLWFNLSARALRVRLASAVTQLGPGQSRLLTPGVAPGATYPVMVDLMPGPADPEPQPLLRSTWIRESGRRQLLFVLQDPDRPVPRVVAVPHRMLPPPVVAAPAR